MWIYFRLSRRPEDIPIRLIDGKNPQILIHEREDHEIVDNGDILDRKCNIIIERSMMIAYTTEVGHIVAENDRDFAKINDQIDQSEQSRIYNRSEKRIDGFHGLCYYENIPGKIIEYQKKKPTLKYLRSIINRFLKKD